MRRLIFMATGFVIAVGVGAVFLFSAALFDAQTRDAGLNAVAAGLLSTVDEALEDGDPRQVFGALGFVFWAVTVATCVAPLAIAALIGEAAGVRALSWYSGVSGLLAGASPWIARAAKGLPSAHDVAPGEGRIALLFFLTGALCGAIYWLVAAPRIRPAREGITRGAP